jgi:hypothetical protein
MKENRWLIFKSLMWVTMLTMTLIIWVNAILHQQERKWTQEPLNASQMDARMLEFDGYENVYREVGIVQSEDIATDTIDPKIYSKIYTKKGRLKNNLNK